jgi:glycosyltransferase involved in cell wall biosynthesis
MKILFIHNAYQNWGGEDVVLDSEIALLRDYGHEVELYKRHNDELHDLSFASAAVSTIWSRRSAAEVEAACDIFQPQLIHAHNTFPLVSPSIYWTAARKRIPVIQTLHNFRMLCPQGTFLRNGGICEDCIGKLPWRAIARKCYRKSIPQSAVLVSMLGIHRIAGTYRNKVTRFIALSAFLRDRFIAGGIPAEQLRIKPNFVESNRQPSWNNRQGGLYVGRLSIEKGIGTLLEALREGANNNIEVIGSGPCEATVSEHLEERYLGFLPKEDIQNRMHCASFLIVPSIGYEHLPTTILEAFSCGLPVIASRFGSLAEIVQDGVTGMLFNSGDATDLARKILWAEAHPEQMQKMGRAARVEYEAKYTPSINYKIMVDIYEDAIAAVQDGRRVA